MNFPQSDDNKNQNQKCAAQNRRCPISEMGAETAKKLAESYEMLINAAVKADAAEGCPDFLRRHAWQRAERVGRVLDNLLGGWETQSCPPLCFNCDWQNCQRALTILDVFTPCNQWFIPELPRRQTDD